MDIQTLTIEFLRAGPRHNQLLSPLTQYLGVCGNFPASRVTFPYEHGDIERRLQELRYAVIATEDKRRARKVLEQTGREIAQVLSNIDGLAGMLDPKGDQQNTLTHLRIVISASELAMLPFEAAKVPTGTGSGAGSLWLALRSRAPVCITRQIRSVAVDGLPWPTSPRVLFIAGPETPLEEHQKALETAMAPWRDQDDSVANLLTVLKEPTTKEIKKALADAAASGKPFTHVHVLAHGTQIDDGDIYSPVGLMLSDREGKPVPGDQLASTLTSFSREEKVLAPTVVTLASCDSARQVDVRTADAAFAHDLHDRGIPLVVASQFPLTEEGSVPFVSRFYEGQLRGEHPLVSLYAVRLDLHSSMSSDSHDWASIVVYESLPPDLSLQLENLRYWQSRRALDGALNRLEEIAKKNSAGTDALRKETLKSVDSGVAELPTTGPYALECAGLRASAHKRVAIDAMEYADRTKNGERVDALAEECRRRLHKSRTEYWRASRAFLAPSAASLRRKSNLHWLLGQVISLDVVLNQPLDLPLLTAACIAADIDLEGTDEVERAWAHVSHTELLLLRLAEAGLKPERRKAIAEKALEHAQAFISLVGPGSEHMATTWRQIDRYVSWWGNRERQRLLGKLGIPKRDHWHVDNGLVPTAMAVANLLLKNGGGNPQARTESSTATARAPEPAKKTSTAVKTLARPARPANQFLAVEMLPAEHGDCLLIEYGDRTRRSRVLVDCGAKSSVPVIAGRLGATRANGGARCDLFVLTHIDADHINGVLTLFDQRGVRFQFGDIWFNGWHQIRHFLGVRQGEAFSKLLEDPARELPWNRAFSRRGEKYPGPVVMAEGSPLPVVKLPGGMRVTLLSPGPKQLARLGQDWREVLIELDPKKAKMLGRRNRPTPVTDFETFDVKKLAATPAKADPSVANGSSIALLAEFGGRSVLLTGDAHADVVEKSIRGLQEARGSAGQRLQVDALKLSHHGSANATTRPLLDAINCRNYLVSTNGNHFYHPDRESIARVIIHGGEQPILHFNYRTQYNDLWDSALLKDRYKYETRYPNEGAEGLRVEL
jgi:beta-lactamase superfamily II metal-dependent hydrolase